jgi:hypothetical protein
MALQMAKNMNIGAGLFPGRWSLMIGNKRMLRAEPPQLTIVENGKKSGSTIYGMYIQTMGPKLRLKLAM